MPDVFIAASCEQVGYDVKVDLKMRSWKIPPARAVYKRLCRVARSTLRDAEFPNDVWILFHALYLPHLDPNARGTTHYQINGYTWEDYNRGSQWCQWAIRKMPARVPLRMVVRHQTGRLP